MSIFRHKRQFGWFIVVDVVVVCVCLCPRHVLEKSSSLIIHLVVGAESSSGLMLFQPRERGSTGCQIRTIEWVWWCSIETVTGGRFVCALSWRMLAQHCSSLNTTRRHVWISWLMITRWGDNSTTMAVLLATTTNVFKWTIREDDLFIAH